MNRNEKYNRSRRMHYGDLDQSGSRRNKSDYDYSYYPDRDDFSESDSSLKSNTPSDSYYGRTTSGARAFGDYSSGSRYGEGGSTWGGGSYSKQGRRNMNFDRNRSKSIHRGYGNMAANSSRNYGSFGGSNEYTDYMNHNYGPYSHRNTEREFRSGNTGYDRDQSGFGRTGYGSTGFNNRDEDRERSVYGSSGSRNSYHRYGADSDRGGYVNKDPNY